MAEPPGTATEVVRPDRGPPAEDITAGHRTQAVAAAVAGPLLIVAGALVILRRFITGSLFPRQFEAIGVWLTTFCYQGRVLRAGHLPSLNPHVMGGIPFIPDPQSGWWNAPAMALFTILRCDIAFRAYLVLLPILAGLGIYWFLRSEGVARPSATVGGLALALPVAGSRVFMIPWISGWVAWTAVTLAAASRFWHARERWRQIAWGLLVALSWGQLSSAHFSTGLAIGSLYLGAYLLAKAIDDVVHQRSRLPVLVARVAFVIFVLVLVNLGAVLPRVVYVHRTPLGLGLHQLQMLSAQFGGNAGRRGAGTLPAPWPLGIALSPGFHPGALALALCLGGLIIAARRPVAIAVVSIAAVCYVLTLSPVAGFLAPRIEKSSFSHLYLHGPDRYGPGLFVAVAALAGLGVDAWLRAGSVRARASITAPGILLWGIPLAIYRPPAVRLSLLLLGALLGIVALVLSSRVRRLALLIPLVVSVELYLNSRSPSGAALAAISRRDGTVTVINQPAWMKVDVAAYLRPGTIAKALARGGFARYVTSDPRSYDVNGYFGRDRPAFWGLMGNQQSMLFGLREAQGYDATLPLRFWEFVRAVDPRKLNYPPDYFRRVPPVVLDLMQVCWIVGRATGPPPAAGATLVTTQGPWGLYRLPKTPPMASLIGQWADVGSTDQALTEITAVGFDPESIVIVERNPGVASGEPGRAGEASYRQQGPQAAMIIVTATRPGIVLVRNTYDPNWHASVDGHRVKVLPADYVIQGVPVPAGRHVIRLWYDDPTIGYGLAGSGLSVAVLLGAAFILRRRERAPAGELANAATEGTPRT